MSLYTCPHCKVDQDLSSGQTVCQSCFRLVEQTLVIPDRPRLAAAVVPPPPRPYQDYSAAGVGWPHAGGGSEEVPRGVMIVIVRMLITTVLGFFTFGDISTNPLADTSRRTLLLGLIGWVMLINLAGVVGVLSRTNWGRMLAIVANASDFVVAVIVTLLGGMVGISPRLLIGLFADLWAVGYLFMEDQYFLP